MKKIKFRRFSLAELMIVIAALGILAVLISPIDNFSYIAGSIITRSIESSRPVKKAVEAYYSENKRFPNHNTDIHFSLLNVKKSDHMKDISVSAAGKIVITYDTSDINWASNRSMPSNDLTAKALILSPQLINGHFIWDECNKGSVPKRSRDYKCSKHL